MSLVEKSRVMFSLASVLFVFTLIWGLVGESEIKILGVFIGFACFIYRGINYEMAQRAQEVHH